MSIASKLRYILILKENIKNKIVQRGGTPSQNYGLSTFENDIDTIPNIWKVMIASRNSLPDGWKYAFWEFPYKVFRDMTETEKDENGNTLFSPIEITRSDLQYAFYNFARSGNEGGDKIELGKYLYLSDRAGLNLYKCFQNAMVSKIATWGENISDRHPINIEGTASSTTQNCPSGWGRSEGPGALVERMKFRIIGLISKNLLSRKEIVVKWYKKDLKTSRRKRGTDGPVPFMAGGSGGCRRGRSEGIK